MISRIVAQIVFLYNSRVKRIASLLSLPSEDILSAGFIIMGLSALSGVLGLVRDRLLSLQFTPDLVGIYFAAFVIPENLFQILILGALGSAFMPVFSKYRQHGGGWDFALSFMHLSAGIFVIAVTIVFLFVEPLSLALVPGLSKENPAHLALLTNLTRIILLSQLAFVVSYLFTAILQSFHRFIIPALTPVFYNIGIILGLLFLAPTFGMYGVALGVVIGALLHLLIQVPYLRRLGFTYQFRTDFSHKGIIETIELMVPRTIAILIERLRLTIDTILASLISLSSITFLNFAMHVAVFPISLFASAISQAAFPFLTRAASKGDLAEFKQYMSVSLTHIAFFLAPMSILLVILHTPIVRLIFGSRLFSWEATFLTSWTLVFLSLGLLFQGPGILLARGFYALYDTKTPLLVTSISLFITITLSLVFILLLHLPVWSLGASATVGAIVNATLLFVLLDRRIGGFNRFSLFISFAKILFISLFLAIFTYATFKFLEQFFDTTYTLPLLIFTILVTVCSMGFYLLLSFVFNLEEYKALATFFHKIKRAPKIFMQKEVMVDGSELNP